MEGKNSGNGDNKEIIDYYVIIDNSAPLYVRIFYSRCAYRHKESLGRRIMDDADKKFLCRFMMRKRNKCCVIIRKYYIYIYIYIKEYI